MTDAHILYQQRPASSQQAIHQEILFFDDFKHEDGNVSEAHFDRASVAKFARDLASTTHSLALFISFVAGRALGPHQV